MLHCNNCYKKHHVLISKSCSICQKLSFDESILCDLLRFSEENNDVECFSFKPNLVVVGENKKSDEAINDKKNIDEHNKEKIKGGLSNKNKWLKALALQQWGTDPDKVICDLSFHVCLISRNREAFASVIIPSLFVTTPTPTKLFQPEPSE